MALIIENRQEMVSSVGVIIKADQGVIDDIFPIAKYHTTPSITFDMAKVEGVVSEYNSFSNTANVVEKDGKDVVKLNAVNLNDSISKETADADLTQFGQSSFGTGEIDPELQAALDSVAKIRLNHLATKKAIAYEVLTTFQIKNGYSDKKGTHDIIFPVPAENKVVFDGTTEGQLYWSDSDATPLDNIYNAWLKMDIRPSRVIMNHVTYSNFYNNSQVNTIDNTTNGTKKNYVINETPPQDAKYFTAGTIMYKGMIITVKVETQTKSNGTPYMPSGYVSLASPVGEVHHAGIPESRADGIARLAKEWDVFEHITQNPPQHEYIVRTGATPLIKNGYAFYSMKVEA